MDAVEFLRDFRRMCWSYGSTCTDCKLADALGTPCMPTKSDCDHEKLIRVVEEWAKEHPVKTRLSEFLKLFPNASVTQIDGCPGSCIKIFDLTADCEVSGKCPDCKNKFWLTPIEEEEK